METIARPVTLSRPKLRGTIEAFAFRLFGAQVTRTNASNAHQVGSDPGSQVGSHQRASWGHWAFETCIWTAVQPCRATPTDDMSIVRIEEFSSAPELAQPASSTGRAVPASEQERLLATSAEYLRCELTLAAGTARRQALARSCEVGRNDAEL